MRCPDCRGDDVAAIEMIWGQGAPGSALAAAARPPQRSGMFWPGVGVLAIAVAIAVIAGPAVADAYRALLLPAALVAAVIAIFALGSAATRDWQARLKLWRANWVCRRCGHIDARAAFEAEGPKPGG